MWTFEPSAALSIMQDLVREFEIPVKYEQRLDRTGGSNSSSRVRGVTLDGKRIVAIKTESGHTYRGRVFIDATYEGDLLAGAGIPYTVGRESNEVYGETLNGVQTRNAKYHQFVPGVDPYVVPRRRIQWFAPRHRRTTGQARKGAAIGAYKLSVSACA